MRTSCCKPWAWRFYSLSLTFFIVIFLLLLLLGPGASEHWEHSAANPGLWRICSLALIFFTVTFFSLLLLDPAACKHWEHPAAANPRLWRFHSLSLTCNIVTFLSLLSRPRSLWAMRTSCCKPWALTWPSTILTRTWSSAARWSKVRGFSSSLPSKYFPL